ncbi:MAG TPA: tetratricopeptide repeat protein [Longimicrobium sp.]|nr:tetratricopeptide repeat protein [Longimicrobium sp.]
MSATHPALARAQLLMEQRRYRMAEDELRKALRDEPESAPLHAYLALCMAEDPARRREAMEEAMWATAYDPVLPTGWYVLSLLQSRQGAVFEAEKTARLALGLAPEMPPLLLHLATLMMDRERYRDGLEFAERALAVAPDDAGALMTTGALRSRLGRHAEAEADFARALARAPDDHAVQANAGWAALRRGDPAAAVRHFRASLRREPGERSAQRGLLEALRARNPAYRGFLRVALRMYWMPGFMKWVAIGFSIVLLAWVSIYDLPPWLLLPLQAAVIAAAVFTWTARPLADLLMLSDPAGRAVLDRAQKVAAVGVAALLAAAVLLGAAWTLGAPKGSGMAAILTIFFTIPFTTAPQLPRGPWRLALAAWTVLLAVPAVLTVLHHARGTGDPGFWLGLTLSGLVVPDFAVAMVAETRR